MSRTITQRELRNESGSILRAAEQGEEFIVTRNGTPIARLTPLVDESPFVSAEVMRNSAVGLPKIDFHEFRHDLDEVVDSEFRDPYERNA
ncbi:type II toxin-antitoxin system Phd/YefM family antitoxin [Glycomyces arizonensis]|uniref:type II toxin-antitoxin system Phd/YefM family antitoxin n=1 Tax=Glycomyces arizonensis TaxID=256035 RepID=UPI00054D8D7B|nr:type II toxin-antitoxin system prevent-host-death family antitoxin [Glycomyces arizonensis]